jgi:hypothetical protein
MLVFHLNRESADAGRRANGRGEAMSVIWLQITTKTARGVAGRTEPDLHLIKQVEQVTTSGLEGPAWRFAGIPSVGITDAVEVLVFPIWQLLIGC